MELKQQKEIKFGLICIPNIYYIPEKYLNLSYKEIVKLNDDCGRCAIDLVSDRIIDENDKEEGKEAEKDL